MKNIVLNRMQAFKTYVWSPDFCFIFNALMKRNAKYWPNCGFWRVTTFHWRFMMHGNKLDAQWLVDIQGNISPISGCSCRKTKYMTDMISTIRERTCRIFKFSPQQQESKCANHDLYNKMTFQNDFIKICILIRKEISFHSRS